MKLEELKFGAALVMEASETVRQARLMEELGYDYFAAGEHFMRGNPPLPTNAAFPVLGVAAGATQSIRLLSSIVLAPFYHPLFLARSAATLDAASNGRLTLGVGVGGEYPVEFEASGLKVTQRGRRTDECLEIVRRLWSEEPVCYAGRHFNLDGAMINPGPQQKPGPPIWVSGRRDAAMHRAARLGDGWLPYFFDPDRYQDSVSKVNSFASEVGRPMDKFQWGIFSYISIYPTLEEAAEVAARGLGRAYVYSGEFINIVRRYCLLGPPEQCIRRLQEYIDAGARHIVFSVTCPKQDSVRHLETIAKEIIPHFRKKR